ncbi:hypothetical protein HHL19_06580 [Streptomyces sp. R302]|uniref:hypothetical protein n=1 Tax=unclassified Streptomyces TaxID=2593676 RepID=UPI00145C435E|nr:MULTISPECIES: hypothetical protein [unclassified Streptomyces]NML53383.1 hypothetical protein [Streptomyces sp. R301]NML78337.1 hypothetical protein [Streptomyces sp. R302]
MSWNEWEQIKAETAERDSTQMRLNGLPEESGWSTGGGDLVVHDDQLGAIGNKAYDLRERFRVDADHARPSTFKASVDLFNDGLDLGAALTEMHDAWNTQQQALKEACAHISNHLDFTQAQHAKDEADIQTGLRDATGDLMTVSRLDELFK